MNIVFLLTKKKARVINFVVEIIVYTKSNEPRNMLSLNKCNLNISEREGSTK